MISFIVIGRNEGKNLERCIKGICSAISCNKISNYEILYIDSDSIDDSVEIVKQFAEIRIFKITNIYNAAIARNIGFKQSKGDSLFFIDGDIELMPEFLAYVLDGNQKLKYDFVSGQLIDARFDNAGNYLGEFPYNVNVIKQDKKFPTTGGTFLIKRELWALVNGMNNKYRRSQDLDFGLRLARRNILLLRKKEILGKHNTVTYSDRKRMWTMMLNGDYSYVKGPLYREHLFNRHIYRIILRDNFTTLLLIACIFLLPYSQTMFLIYPIGVIFQSMRIYIKMNRKKNFLDFLNRVPHIIFADVFSILSFLFFYPQNIDLQDISYVEINAK